MPLTCDYQVCMSLGEPGRLWPMAPNLAPGQPTAHELRMSLHWRSTLLTSPVNSSHTSTMRAIKHQVPEDDQFTAAGVLGRSRCGPVRSDHHQHHCSRGAASAMKRTLARSSEILPAALTSAKRLSLGDLLE
jgi:hypothetical protein